MTDTTTITLKNPVANHFSTYIFGNATKCERVAEENSAKGQTLVICGAGPSLKETAAKFVPRGDQVWGCNSAATWLVENGYKCTHGFTVDQTAHMLAEWASVPEMEYLIASSCDPHLHDLLAGAGRKVWYFHNYVGANGDYGLCNVCKQQFEAVRFNDERQADCPHCGSSDTRLVPMRIVSYGVCQACGEMTDGNATACGKCGGIDLDTRTVQWEDWLYAMLYPATIRTGSGLNATTRAIDLALFMGFKKIYVLGADCALRVNRPMPHGVAQGSPAHLRWLDEDVVMHADGGSALASQASAVTLEGEIDGRRWLTKPDMMITAIWLRSMKIALGSRLSIIGDTLVKAILEKDDAFILRLPNMIGPDGKPWVGKFEERAT